jgi:GT2 family glycosyltransferase
MIEVSIVIPSKDRPKELYELVKSIIKSDFNLEKVELIIIDDSTIPIQEKTFKKFKSFFKEFKIIRNFKDSGVAFSRNKGAKLAKGKFLLFIDDDNVVSQKFISKLYNFIRKNKKIAMVGGFSYFYKERKKVNHGAWYVDLSKEAIKKGFFVFQKVEDKKVLNADYIPNAFLIRKEIFKKVKFDTHFRGAYFEDVDFGLRVKPFGEIKILPRAKIYHKQNPDESDFFRNIQKLLNYDYNFIYFCKKHRIDMITTFLGLVRIKVRFLYELFKRGYLKNFLIYLMSFFTDLLSFLKILNINL